MTTTARARRALASLTVLAASLVGGGLVLGLAPAAVTPAAGAATCTSAGGVSVVVDYRELGGGTVTACAPDGGGRSAAAIFASVGVDISYATRQPGFVCRVNGVPTSDPCVNASPANAYWGLWWSDGAKRTWTYSSYAVGALTVPAGGSVGWAWQQDRETSGAVPPGVAPPVNTSTPTPTSSPTSSGSSSPSATPTSSPTSSPSGGGSHSPSPGASTGSSSPSATTSASQLGSESPSDSRSKSWEEKRSKGGAARSESPGDSPSSDAGDTPGSASESPSDSSPTASSEAASPAADQPGRVPAVVTWGIVGLLAVAIVASALLARRRRGA